MLNIFDNILFRPSFGLPSYCISPNVGRYYGFVTGPPPPPDMEATMEAMEAMEAAAATERFRRLFVCL